jgi:hypothetical protein
VVGSKPGFLEALDPQGSMEEKARSVASAAIPSPMALLERAAPELVPFVSSVAPLAEGERSVTALPYALTVK